MMVRNFDFFFNHGEIFFSTIIAQLMAEKVGKRTVQKYSRSNQLQLSNCHLGGKWSRDRVDTGHETFRDRWFRPHLGNTESGKNQIWRNTWFQTEERNVTVCVCIRYYTFIWRSYLCQTRLISVMLFVWNGYDEQGF